MILVWSWKGGIMVFLTSEVPFYTTQQNRSVVERDLKITLEREIQ
jgi:hypothetical protein